MLAITIICTCKKKREGKKKKTPAQGLPLSLPALALLLPSGAPQDRAHHFEPLIIRHHMHCLALPVFRLPGLHPLPQL